jgi:hypothetical protein
MINKDQLIFDPTELASSDAVGAYLRSSDGTLLTHTDVGGKKSLDVNVANTVTATVSATDLDIRDLVFATDKVDVTGSSVELGATTLAALENISAIVTATDLDIRDLAFATDKVDVSGSSVTVSATDLDIRNLSHSQDNVAIAQGGNTMVVNADGSINANVDVSVVNGSDKAEDAAHISGDIGTYILSVREDVLSSSTSASGDYQSLKTDKLGRAYVNDSNQSAAFSAVVVAATATDLVPTDLANRKSILIQNIGSKNIFIGNSGVTVSNGIRLSAGSSAEFSITDNVNVYAISQTGTSEVRVMELA